PHQRRAIPRRAPCEEPEQPELGPEAERAVEQAAHQPPVVFPGRQADAARSAGDPLELVRLGFAVPARAFLVEAAEILEARQLLDLAVKAELGEEHGIRRRLLHERSEEHTSE